MIIGIEATHANKDHRTGVEEYCWQMIQHLKKQIPADVQVVLYSNEPLKGDLGVLPPNWKVKILTWPLKKMWSQVCLSWEFLRYPPDVFFAPGQLIPMLCPKNTIVTVHDSAFMVFPQAYHFFGCQYLKLMNRLIMWKAKKIVTPSEFSKQEMIKFYGNKMADKIIVTPLGYDKERFNLENIKNGEEERVAKKNGILKPYIIAVNRLEEKKNTKRIVQAFNVLKSTGNDTQLVLVGKPGVGYEEIKKEIDASANKADIITPGWVEDTDIAPLIAGGQVFVVPSLYEGFGLPVLQAMAVGCPVVASTGSSLEEVGGDAALYANPQSSLDIADKIFQILQNPALRQEKIEFGLERVKQYSWDKTAVKTAEVLLHCHN